MELPDPVSTHRLHLRLITPGQARAALDGGRDPSWHPDFPRKDDLDAMSMVRGHSWDVRLMVRGWDGLVCGTIGFFGPPETLDDGSLEAEVGYGLVEEARGHGLATEALTAAIKWFEDARGPRELACMIDPPNTASIRVAEKHGFVVNRRSLYHGEEVIVFSRPSTPRRASRATAGVHKMPDR